MNVNRGTLNYCTSLRKRPSKTWRLCLPVVSVQRVNYSSCVIYDAPCTIAK